MIDLNEVQMFVEVVRAGSFSAAARQLSVPANTLSRRIGHLESHLDARLMHRSTRKLTLTAAGRTFFDRVGPLLSGIFEAEIEISDRSNVPSGMVRFAAPADFMSVFRAEWLVDYLDRHPRVQVDFVLDDAKVDMIASGIDVAMRVEPDESPGLIYRHAVHRHSTLVASPAYLKRRGTPTSLADLADHDCLAGSSRNQTVSWLLQGPRGVEEVQVSGRIRASNGQSLMRASIAGLGIALLPEILIAQELRSGTLVALLTDYRRRGDEYKFVFPSRRQVPLAVSTFADFVGEKLRSLLLEGTSERARPPAGALKVAARRKLTQ